MRSRIARVIALCSFALLVLPAPAAPATDGADPVMPQWGPLTSPIRPGSQLGSSCSFNFIFYEEVYATEEDPNPIPDIYIGTAGHCTSQLGQRISLGGGFGQIGSVVYDSDLVGSNVDFSLILLDAHLVGQTNPQMRGFAGPKGAVTPSMLALGDIVDVYGYGVGVGATEQTRPRQGFLATWNENEYQANMPAVNGDSGAPILHDETGYALGIISRYGFTVPPSTDLGPIMPWIMRELVKAGFDKVRLATIA